MRYASTVSAVGFSVRTSGTVAVKVMGLVITASQCF
jgi:hypothetical protein